MCRIRNCKRHVFDKTLCLTHYREAVEAGVGINHLHTWNPKDTRKTVKVDAVDVLTTDLDEMETRDE